MVFLFWKCREEERLQNIEDIGLCPYRAGHRKKGCRKKDEKRLAQAGGGVTRRSDTAPYKLIKKGRNLS